MQSVRQKHLIICLLLGLAAIPVYFLDMASMEGGSGTWIKFDFRGLIFWTYIALLAIEVAMSSIAILLFPNSAIWRIHLGSILLSMILLITGFIIYGKLLRAHNISGRSANSPEAVVDLNANKIQLQGGDFTDDALLVIVFTSRPRSAGSE